MIEKPSSGRRLLKVGDVVNRRFVLEETIGVGGMGTVYRALDLRRQETQDRSPYVALKVIKDELSDRPDAIRALQREVRKNQRLKHHNAASVYDYDRDGDLSYITMELLSGETLDKRMARALPGVIPLPEARRILSQVASALNAAHAIDLIHLDLKPANIFIESNGEVKLIDFGIAKVLQKPGAEDITLFDVGKLGALTPAYASVEMLLGEEVDGRDDVYSFSVIAYELITGRHPFKRKTALIASAQHLKAAKPEVLTERQWQALLCGLDFDRSRRVSTANQVADGLCDDIKAPAASPVRRPDIGRWHMLVGVLASGAVFAAALGATTLWHSTVPRSEPTTGAPPAAPLPEIQPQAVPAPPSVQSFAPSGPVPTDPAVSQSGAGNTLAPGVTDTRSSTPVQISAPPPEPQALRPSPDTRPANLSGPSQGLSPQPQPEPPTILPGGLPAAGPNAPRPPAPSPKGVTTAVRPRQQRYNAIGPTMRRIQKEVEAREPGTEQVDTTLFDDPGASPPAPSPRERTRGTGNKAVRTADPAFEAASPEPSPPQDTGRGAPVAASSESAGRPGPITDTPSRPSEPTSKPSTQPSITMWYPGRRSQPQSQ